MKLFLFGGAETGQAAAELKLVEQVIKSIGAKQVLHIPFARVIARTDEWQGDWYHRYISLPGVEYLNANNAEDVARAHNALLFISGGKQKMNLLEKLNASPLLVSLIKNASHIVAESAGARMLGEYIRTDTDEIVPGLGIIKDAVIEPHYTEQKREPRLDDMMKNTNVKYGVGIDAMTAMVFELDQFPEKYEKIGEGMIEVKLNNSLRV